MTSKPSRRLYDLVRHQNWDSVLNRIQTHPFDSIWQEENNGYTALHAAVRRKPPINVIVELIANSSPEINPTKLKTYHGETALHLACSHDASTNVILFLIESYPDAISIQDLDDLRTPLHLACCTTSISSRVIHALLEVCPESASMVDIHGKTPLKLLGECYKDMLRSGVSSLYSAPSPSSAIVMHLGSCWDKMSHLVMAAYHGTVQISSLSSSDKKRWRIVHACATLEDCPLEFLELALKVRPEQVREKDEDENLPIHLASSATAACASRTDGEKSVIGVLLSVYPGAGSICNGNGKLPLEIAVKSGLRWKDGVKSIIDSYPVALAGMDVALEMYPFILGASGRDNVPNTLLEILKFKPDLMKYAGEKV